LTSRGWSLEKGYWCWLECKLRRYGSVAFGWKVVIIEFMIWQGILDQLDLLLLSLSNVADVSIHFSLLKLLLAVEMA